MRNSNTGLQSGFSVGTVQDSLVTQKPLCTYIVSPQSQANSCNTPASGVTQQTVNLWVANTTGGPTYKQVATPLIWALTITGPKTYQGVPVAVLDCLRNVVLTFNSVTTNPFIVTIDGYDNRGVEVVWTSSQQSGVTVVTSLKCFKLVKSVSFTAYPWGTLNSANTVLIQGSCIANETFIGLPYFVNDAASVFYVSFNGDTEPYDIGSLWRQTSITPPINPETSVPSATSGDARGYVSITNSVPNGTAVLTVLYYVYGADQDLNDQMRMLYPAVYGPSSSVFNYAVDPQSCVQIVGLQQNQNEIYALTSLVDQDIYGAQFPGDNAFMDSYNLLLKA